MNEHAHESVNVNVPHGMHGTRPALPPGRVVSLSRLLGLRLRCLRLSASGPP